MKTMFRPTIDNSTWKASAGAIKSLIELIKMKERFESINRNNEGSEYELVHILFNQIANETCRWVSLELARCKHIKL